MTLKENVKNTEAVVYEPLINKRMDRRDFFRKLCALSGTLVIPASVLTTGCSQSGTSDTGALVDEVGQPAADPVVNTTAFSKQVFEETIDTVFSVTHATYGVVDLQLNIVADEVFIPESEQFSISLSGPLTPLLAEGTHDVYNDNLGNIELYLQPGSSSNGQQFYVAVFSLLNT